MKKKKKLKKLLGVLLIMVLAAGVRGKAYAAETDGFFPDNDEKAISVEFPVFSEADHSPFDFILDPQGLINATNAVRYGGRTFEKGATLYFENTDGEYDFSSTSDFLTIINRSAVPVSVSISASLNNMEEISLFQDASFTDSQAHLYLALADDRGVTVPFDEEGKAQLVYEMTGQDTEGITAYSFGLTGACNPQADWSVISVKPHVTVTWTVESAAEEEGEDPALPDEENAALSEHEAAEKADTKDDILSAEEGGETGEEAAENSDEAQESSETGEETAGNSDEAQESGETGEEAAENSDEAQESGETGEEAAENNNEAEEITEEKDTIEDSSGGEKETAGQISETGNETDASEETESDSGEESALEDTAAADEASAGSADTEETEINAG